VVKSDYYLGVSALVKYYGDGTLVNAAKVEGLLTDNPFDHISSQDVPRATRAIE
jgi:hypothetical protein